MRILVMNPNSTVSMTDKIVESARQAASEGTEIIAATGGAPAPASMATAAKAAVYSAAALR